MTKNATVPATARVAKDAPAKPAKEKAVAQPCLCGCGDTPFNPKSRFIPGHDARLKGRIIENLRAKANGKPEPHTVTKEQTAYAVEKWDHLIDFSGEKYKKPVKEAKPKADPATVEIQKSASKAAAK